MLNKCPVQIFSCSPNGGICFYFLNNFSVAVVNLTLIDLPGLTKVAVGMFLFVFILPSFWHKLYPMQRHVIFAEGQQESIVEDIENMVRTYVEKVKIKHKSILTCIYLNSNYLG